MNARSLPKNGKSYMPTKCSVDYHAMTAKQKRDYFDEVSEKHRQQMWRHDDITNELDSGPHSSIIVFIGPTGVGKTTVLRHIARDLLNRERKAMEGDSAYLPFSYVEVPSYGKNTFSWADLYARSVGELLNPFFEEPPTPADLTALKVALTTRPPRLSQGRKAFEQAVRYRRTIAVAFDEVQHALNVGRIGLPGHQLDTFKSLASTARTTLILSGTYEVPAITGLSGQLSRRLILVHFRRYRTDVKDEQDEFVRVAKRLLEQMPVAEVATLCDAVDYLFAYTLGCVGVLKGWLARALARCLRRKKGSDKILWNDLTATQHRHQELATMYEEIKKGERMMSDIRPSTFQKLIRNARGVDSSALSGGTPPVTETDAARRAKSKRPVGRRNPARDPVGHATPSNRGT